VAPRSTIRVGATDRPGAGVPRTIIHVVAPGEVGGLESVVLALAAGQTRRGHRVIVAAVSESSSENAFVRALAAAGVTAAPITVPARAYLKERSLIKELCAREHPHILHTHGSRPDVLHGASRLRRKFGTVTTLHGSSRVGGVSRLHELLQLLLLRRFDGVIAVSRQLANELRGRAVKAERLHVIPNAWSSTSPSFDRDEARRLLNLPLAGVVVGWVGRLIPIKGCDVFLEAARALENLPLTISIIGDGSERPRLEEFARTHGLEHRVRFHGIVADAARYMKAYDVFVLSSRSEGTPVTLLEAISAAVPVVVTRVGGVPDVVTSAEGILVSSEAPPELARGIVSVLDDPAAAAARAAAARAKLDAEFDVEDWIDSHDRVYDLISATRDREPL
jgi:glycosyltransferase involved in cell wall biosynthesis